MNPLECVQRIVKTHQRYPTMEETPSNQMAKMSQSSEVTKNPSANPFECSQQFTNSVRLGVGF